MIKKNLPNIPIYIGDWERDCNILSLESEMAWMKIIFKMHLSGKQSIYKTSTKGLQILWKSSQEKVSEILDELRFNEICEITDINGGYEFLCRRLKKENDLSETRSNAVKERYKTDKKEKKKTTKPLQTTYKPLQNTENEIESDVDNESKDVVKNVNKLSENDFSEIVNIFHSVCVDLPKVEKLTVQRKTAITNIVKEHSLEILGNVFKKVAESDFLSGRKSDWKSSFDWVLTPKNFIKILEDNYKNIKNGNNNQSRTDADLKEAVNNTVDNFYGVQK